LGSGSGLGLGFGFEVMSGPRRVGGERGSVNVGGGGGEEGGGPGSRPAGMVTAI
jgi:hypothetical protein